MIGKPPREINKQVSAYGTESHPYVWLRQQHGPSMKCLVGFGHVGSTFGVTVGLAHTDPAFALTVVFPFT